MTSTPGWLPDLLGGLGVLCLVIATAHVATALAWLVVGVAPVAKAYELELRQR